VSNLRLERASGDAAAISARILNATRQLGGPNESKGARRVKSWVGRKEIGAGGVGGWGGVGVGAGGGGGVVWVEDCKK
jgi:hypothetical protein